MNYGTGGSRNSGENEAAFRLGDGAVELPGCFDPLFDNDFDVGKPVARPPVLRSAVLLVMALTVLHPFAVSRLRRVFVIVAGSKQEPQTAETTVCATH